MNWVTLENFRCFRERQTARLAPLTLLVGENSAGKTSFLALIQALRRAAASFSAPDFKEEPYDLGSFDEIAHHRGGRGSRADSFEAGFGVCNERGDFIDFDMTFEKLGAAPVPVRWRLSDKEKDVWIECRIQENRSWKVHLGISGRVREGKVDDRWGNNVLLQLHFTVFTILKDGKRLSRNDLKRIQNLLGPYDISSNLRGSHEISSRGLYASAPVRSKPRRTYDPSRPARDPGGDYVPMYLASIHDDKRKWDALKNALETFGEGAGLFDEISIRRLGKGGSEPFQVQVRKSGKRIKGPPRNLIDVGYGVSQVLPVVTELLRADAPPMFLLQQPEVHLHPSAQAALGSLFCRLAGWERQLVVETHSDHLLDRVRMDVRDGEGSLKPEDVSILFFERGDLDARIHSLRLDGQGNVLDAPPGYGQFFLDEQRRSLGL